VFVRADRIQEALQRTAFAYPAKATHTTAHGPQQILRDPAQLCEPGL